MAKMITQFMPAQNLAVTTTNMPNFDISGYSGVALQINTPAGSTGTARIRWSNDGVNFVGGGNVALAASTTVSLNTGVIGPIMQIQMSVTAGAGLYDIYVTAKER